MKDPLQRQGSTQWQFFFGDMRGVSLVPEIQGIEVAMCMKSPALKLGLGELIAGMTCWRTAV